MSIRSIVIGGVNPRRFFCLSAVFFCFNKLWCLNRVTSKLLKSSEFYLGVG